MIKALSEFVGKTVEEIEEVIKENSDNAIYQWHTIANVNKFYEETDVYMYGLIDFCNTSRINKVIYPIKDSVGAKILDFGAGIGMIGLAVAENNDVDYYDVPSKTQEFAKHLVTKFKQKVNFITEEKMRDTTYDIIICMDVLEHLENPMKTVKMLTGLLRPKGIFLTSGLDFSMGPSAPMHLPENVQYKEEYIKYISDNYYLGFYHPTPAEIIYAWTKK